MEIIQYLTCAITVEPEQHCGICGMSRGARGHKIKKNLQEADG